MTQRGNFSPANSHAWHNCSAPKAKHEELWGWQDGTQLHGSGWEFPPKTEAKPKSSAGRAALRDACPARAGCRSGDSSSQSPDVGIAWRREHLHPPAEPQGFSRLGFAPRAVDAGREMLGQASAAPPEAKAVPVPSLTNPRKFKKLPQLTWGCSEGAGIGGGTQPACAQNTQEGFCGGFRHIFTQEALLLWSHAVQEVRARAGQCF